jgi:hypothetical protein
MYSVNSDDFEITPLINITLKVIFIVEKIMLNINPNDVINVKLLFIRKNSIK